MTELKKPPTKSIRLAIPNEYGDGIAEWINVDVPIAIDEDTGEEIVTGEGLQILDDAKARHMGLLLPEQLRALRERFGLTQKRVGELLQIGEKTWTHWETGRGRPSRSMNVLLKALFDGVLPINYLEALSAGVPYSEVVAETIKQLWSQLALQRAAAPEFQWEPSVIGRSAIGLRVLQPVFSGWTFVSSQGFEPACALPWGRRIPGTGEIDPKVQDSHTLSHDPIPVGKWREESKLTRFG